MFSMISYIAGWVVILGHLPRYVHDGDNTPYPQIHLIETRFCIGQQSQNTLPLFVDHLHLHEIPDFQPLLPVGVLIISASHLRSR